jgi:O-methyltransferase
MKSLRNKIERIFGKSGSEDESPGRKALSNARLFAKVKQHTFARPAKLQNLRRLAQALNNKGVPGDLVECGTYKGGSAAVLGTTLTAARHLWLFDSFQGMPNTSKHDGPDAGQYVGQGVASESDVVNVLTDVGVLAGEYTIRKGWFADSFKRELPAQVALLHCDADWYESVLLVLETFYFRVPDGGCVVLDDFGYWEGCREAFYAFCGRHQIQPLLERFGPDQAWWIKGKTNNRN